MNSILEDQRLAHEMMERLEEACVQEFMEQPKTHRERLKLERKVNAYLTRLSAQASKLDTLYKDQDGARAKEIEHISQPNISLDAFYEDLKAINDHHDKYPNQQIDAPEFEFLRVQKHDDTEHDGHDDMDAADQELETLFSGEEQYGRYLDLLAVHNDYVNLKGINRVEYIPFLDRMDRFDAPNVYPPSIKTSDAYRQYLDGFRAYLQGFFERARPLVDLAAIEKKARDAFDASYKPDAPNASENTDALFCKACQKAFSKQTVYDAHLKGKKHVKAQAKLDQDGAEDRVDRRKQTAWHEALIVAYLAEISDTRQQTKANVERKQALTDRERALELEQGDDIEIGGGSDDDSDEERIYNPLKLPLGWDGKPIPYWLYKLHGLGVEYPCEICGNYVYMGRKAFDKHFQESRHAYGMRSLGLPNTRQFHEITKIDDAYALQEKLKKHNVSSQVKTDNVEEYEDDEGNVFNKKTYDDLKRQGLI
ncbi:hypothetical protein BC940DRAFT_303342 [Gongronella butleri]|nr:hypothetical protein BC940DRAFT_303342 [Gongronella butleri]